MTAAEAAVGPKVLLIPWESFLAALCPQQQVPEIHLAVEAQLRLAPGCAPARLALLLAGLRGGVPPLLVQAAFLSASLGLLLLLLPPQRQGETR